MNTRRQPFWTQREDNTLAEMWTNGATCNQIAARLGTTKNAIAGRRSRLGLPQRRTSVLTCAARAEAIDQVAELLAEGFDIPGIAQEMAVSYDTARGMFERIRFELGAQAR